MDFALDFVLEFFYFINSLIPWSLLLVTIVVLVIAFIKWMCPQGDGFGTIALMILSRLIRGGLLLLWIVLLSTVAFGSLNGSLARLVFAVPYGAPSYVVTPYSGRDFRCTGDIALARYLSFREDPPPIGVLLEVVFPKWSEVITNAGASVGPGECKFMALFEKIEGRLRSFARNQNTDPKTIKVDKTILINEFQEALAAIQNLSVNTGSLENVINKQNPPNIVQEFTLPPEVQDWVFRESVRIKDEGQAKSLFSTFLLLSVLGALGTLIFLIRDYVTMDEKRKISDYLFRPVLGVFLAAAVFVVDVLAHSVISSANILQIRSEPLYILALGAGLLSETAYDWVRLNIGSTFARRRQQLERGVDSDQLSVDKPTTTELPSAAPVQSNSDRAPKARGRTAATAPISSRSIGKVEDQSATSTSAQ